MNVLSACNLADATVTVAVLQCVPLSCCLLSAGARELPRYISDLKASRNVELHDDQAQ